MTLLALWYRQKHDDLFAIADSRLSSSQGVLSDQAPKFMPIRINCYLSGNHSKGVVFEATVAVGFAGSSTAAYSSLVTLQGFLSCLSIPQGCSTPRMEDIAAFAEKVVERNFLSFGALWQNSASFVLILFGYLPTDKCYKGFSIDCQLTLSGVVSRREELPLAGNLISTGSCSEYFMQRLSSSKADPFRLLQELIASGERSDIGGFVQVAIADRRSVEFPHILTPRIERGEYAADVSMLGYDTVEFNKVGECEVGGIAIGPNWDELHKIREENGF